MEVFEIETALKTFEILVDTREHETPEMLKRCNSFGVSWKRAKLNYGDYSYNAIINGKALYDSENPINPAAAIERKESLTELSGNFTQSRDRFKREFERAKEAGARMYLVCENATWENLLNHKYRTRFHPNAYLASLTAYMVRYGVNLIFCKAETSGRIIKEILYRDFKERLERGEFDEIHNT